MVDPDRLGWNDRRASEMPPGEDLVPARVAVEHRGAYDLLGMGDDLAEGARVSADLRDRASGRLDFPAVGDWVAVRPGAGPRGADLIEAVLPRTSLFVRRAPGRDPRPQVVGTNIDTVFIATSLDGDLNPRRLERYLAVVHGGDAEPVVLVTKTDLVSEGRELDRARALVASVAPGVEVVPTSVTTGEGLDRLVELIPEGRTAALVGSSGVGKSTIVNAMMGREVQQVAPTR
ncbi:MAG TPA: GTPase RsgA, partial [Acidimicrobiales bacterium]|nr:GTPase RsgA [Acidimicrobiales bacterium]